MRKIIAAFSTLAFSLALSTAASAAGGYGIGETLEVQPPGQQAEKKEETGKREMQAGMKTDRLQEAAAVLGKSVRSEEGEDLGEVSNLLLDPQTGQVRYLSVTASGGEQYAIPWEAVRMTPEAEAIDLGMTAGQFRKAPEGIQLGSREQEEEILDFYGIAPYWQQEEPARPGIFEEPAAEEPGVLEEEGPGLEEQGPAE